MAKCCAPNCMNNQKKDSVVFYEFPENLHLRRQWISNIGRSHWSPGKRSILCSAHFEENQVEMKGQQILLRQNAVPTLFQTSRKKRKLEVSKPYDHSKVQQLKLRLEDVTAISRTTEKQEKTTKTTEIVDSSLNQSLGEEKSNLNLAPNNDKFVVDGAYVLQDSEAVDSKAKSQNPNTNCIRLASEEQTVSSDFKNPLCNFSLPVKGNHNMSLPPESAGTEASIPDKYCKMFLITETNYSNSNGEKFYQLPTAKQDIVCKQVLDLSEIATPFHSETGACIFPLKDNAIIIPTLQTHKLSESNVSFLPKGNDKAKSLVEINELSEPNQFIQKGVIELPISVSCHKWRKNTDKYTEGTVKWQTGTYMCRLCGIASNKTISLFSSRANETRLLERISSILSIKIVPSDELPKNVCFKCLDSLDTCSELIVSSFRTQNQLAAVMGQNLEESSNLSVFFHESEKKSSKTSRQKHILLMEIDHEQGKPFQEYLSIAYNDLHLRLSSKVNETEKPQCNLLLASIKGGCSVSEIEQARAAAEALLCKTLIRKELNETENQPILECSSIHENEFCCDGDNQSNNPLEEDCDVSGSEDISENAAHFESMFESTLVESNSNFQLPLSDVQVMPVVDDASPIEYYALDRKHPNFRQSLEKGKCFLNMQKYFSWLITEDKSIKLSCRVCNTHFDRFTNFQHHLNSHIDYERNTKEIIGRSIQSPQTENKSEETKKYLSSKGISQYQCSLCSEHFPLRSSLKSHLQVHHHEANTKCDGCGHEASNISEASSHRKICHKYKKEKEWQCRKSPEVFVNKSKVQEHHALTSHDTEATTCLCDICGKKYSKQEKLYRHKKSHLAAEFKYIHQCTHCSKVYINSSRLREHMQKHEEKKYMCKVCGKLFSTKQILKQHEFTHGDPQFLCSLCSRTFFRKSHLLKHMNVHNPENSRASRAGPQPHRDGLNRCRECKKVFDQNNLLNHYKTCHPNISLENYLCHICKEENTSYAELYQHQREVHKTGVKECPFCNKTIDSSTQMKYHLMRHEGMFPYNCPLCSNGYTANSVLQDHIRRKHTGEKPFECQQCLKRFPTNGALAQHSTVHSLPHQLLPCPICNQGFKRKAHLDVHIRTHTGEKPYPCPICSRPFRQRPDCVKHIRVIHGEDPSKFDIRFHPNMGVTFPQVVSVADMELILEGEDLMQSSLEANQLLDSQE